MLPLGGVLNAGSAVISFECVFFDDDFRFDQFCGTFPKFVLADRPHFQQGASYIQPEEKKLFFAFRIHVAIDSLYLICLVRHDKDRWF